MHPIWSNKPAMSGDTSYLEAVRLLAWEAKSQAERNPFLELP